MKNYLSLTTILLLALAIVVIPSTVVAQPAAPMTPLDCDHPPTTAQNARAAALAQTTSALSNVTTSYDEVVYNSVNVACSPAGTTVNVVYDLYLGGIRVKQLVVQEDPTISYVVQTKLVNPMPSTVVDEGGMPGSYTTTGPAYTSNSTVQTTTTASPAWGGGYSNWAGYDNWVNPAKVVAIAANYCTSTASCSVTLPSVSKYNLVIASGACPTSFTSFTDNGGLTFTNAYTQTSASEAVPLSYAYSSSTGGSLTVTLNCGYAGTIFIELEDVSGVPSPFTIYIGNGSCVGGSCGTTMSTASPVSFPNADYVAVGAVYATPGSGFTPTTGFTGNLAHSNALGASEYSTSIPPSPFATTSFQMINGAAPPIGQWLLVGAIFTSTATVSGASYALSEAKGYFIVPPLSNPPNGCSTSTPCQITPWIGLSPQPGGGGSCVPSGGCIAQAGAYATLTAGTQTNQLWYEWLPIGATTCATGFVTGDQIFVDEVWNGITANTYSVTIKDTTRSGYACAATSNPGQVPGGQPYYGEFVVELHSGYNTPDDVLTFTSMSLGNSCTGSCSLYSTYTQGTYILYKSNWGNAYTCPGPVSSSNYFSDTSSATQC